MLPGGDRPDQRRLSIVIAAWTGPDQLRGCLNSLTSQVDPHRDEIIVARNFACDEAATGLVVGKSFADIALPGATVPQLRAAGLTVASGDRIAFIEDHCRCSPEWCQAIIGVDTSVAGIGGPVDLGDGGAPIDWAVYFYDYARFIPPMASGPTRSLSGANMSWSRRFLQELAPRLRAGVLESLLERECAQRGLAMHLAGDAVVVHSRKNRPWPALRLAFALGRGYASERVAEAGAVTRAARATVTVLLPFLLLCRIVAATLRSRRHIGRLIVAIPWLVVLVSVWSAGEGVGYLAGAGTSASRWR
jgi:hypothetical protein